MLDTHNLLILAKQIKIAPINIVRENIELDILYFLANSPLSQNMLFYGGTALRLAYASPRFSEDLDFWQTKPFKPQELETLLQGFINQNPDLRLKDFYDKRYIIFALLNARHPGLKKPLNIKIEISKLPNGLDTELIPLNSPVSHLKPILNVVTLPVLKKLKIKTIKDRQRPRDWFDLWYISKLLKNNFDPPIKFPFEVTEFKRELKRFLPRDQWQLIDQLITYVN